jgi:hypothetical protein
VQPFLERLFTDYPKLEYLEPFKRGELPENIQVTEFYFQPGSFHDSPFAQRAYVSSNYSHAVRDLLDAGVNVLAQLVAKEIQNPKSVQPELQSRSHARFSAAPARA